jgi:hypothetical protein
VDATAVEKHHPATDGWKVVRDVEIIECRVLRRYFFEQAAELGDVPLTVAQVVYEQAGLSSPAS